ncbi:NAD(P)H-binding protein [Dactylosporangium sp. NPDC005572]|uniref:NAD(P)H-binding protein n=1 Tax=Dactylosporangium sp. NPDC005572 TaxID=3156889 RepID=UPI0033A6AA62
MIAVTGANGSVGGKVLERLPGARGLTRRDAEYRDTDAMTKALEGVTTLFLVSGRESKDRVAEHWSAVDAAVRAGVERIVYLSFYGAAADCTFTFGRDHWHTEEYIKRSGLRWTFLRDNLYLEMIPRFAGADGLIRGPAGDGRVAAVSCEDVAESVASVLRGEHDHMTYSLTGPEAFTLHEAAEAFGLRYHPETVEEAYAWRKGAPFEVEGWVTSYTAIAAGELAAVTDHVERLTGRRPQGLPTRR